MGATWLTTVASSPTLTQEDCARLTLVRFSSVGRWPTWATEPSVQPDLESGTICRRTSDRRTCTAVSDSRWRQFYFVSGTKAQFESPSKLHFINPLTNLLTYLHSVTKANCFYRIISRQFVKLQFRLPFFSCCQKSAAGRKNRELVFETVALVTSLRSLA